MVAGLPTHIAERELKTVRELLDWQEEECRLLNDREALGPGNVLLRKVVSASITQVFSGFGEKGVPAEKVAANTAQEALHYLKAGGAGRTPAGRSAPAASDPAAVGGMPEPTSRSSESFWREISGRNRLRMAGLSPYPPEGP